MCTHGHPHISRHRPLKTSSHPAVQMHVSPILTCCVVENPRKWCPVSRRSLVTEAMTLFSGVGTEVHLFALQTAVELRMVMSRGQDERSRMHAMSLLRNTCSGMTNSLIDDGARWILQEDEQERENRTAAFKALHSMLAGTTSGRAKELVKRGLSERNGMIVFGRTRERLCKTAGVAKLSDVFQFKWTSPDSLEDK